MKEIGVDIFAGNQKNVCEFWSESFDYADIGFPGPAKVNDTNAEALAVFRVWQMHQDCSGSWMRLNFERR